MGDGLGLYMGDVYPTYGGSYMETSNKVIPDSNDQEALQEMPAEEAKKGTKETRSSRLLFAVLAVIVLIVMFGLS